MDFDPYPMVIKTEIPNNGKAIVDIAPVNQESQSNWLILMYREKQILHSARPRKQAVCGDPQKPLRSG